MDNIIKIRQVEGEIERGQESEDPQIGREGEIERGQESEMDIGEGEVCEAGLAKIDITKVREASLAYYEDLTDDEKQAAKEFFDAMDTNDSNDISIDEFRNFLSHAKIQTDDRLFKELDKDKSGFLDFQEVVTFFYVLSREARDEYKPLLNHRASTDITGRDEYKPLLNHRASTDITGRDEYKPLVHARPSTGRTGRKEESNRPKIGSQQVAEANGQGQKWDMGHFRRLYSKLKRAYKFVEGESECSIV